MNRSTMTCLKPIRLVACFASATCVLATSVFGATPFVREIADASGNIAYYTSLAIDAQGRPHVSAYDFVNGDLRYLTRSRDGRWTVEIIDAAGVVGEYSSLALDAQGNPHIAYHDIPNGNLKYASRVGSTWVIEVADAAANDVGSYASLALDPAGNPHIAYRDATALDLKYATRVGSGAWTVETVTAAGDVGSYASIEVDERYRPHIAFRDVTAADVRYATRAPGNAWVFETVDGAGGSYCSLALDAQGRPRVAYSNSVTALAYATRDEGVWSLETADATANNDISLVLDVSGNPKIACRNIGQSDLRFASKSGSTWTIETVDFGGDVGNYISIALDPHGNPAITYRDNTIWNLVYAESGVELITPLGGERWAAGSQQTVRWRGAGTVSIQLSDNGGQSYTTLIPTTTENMLTITVPNFTTEQARLRINRGSPVSISDSPGYFSIAADLVSPWWTTTADASGNLGTDTSLDLDAQENPHISYYDATTADLKYARKTGGTWTTETVDAAGDVGQYTSLVLDAQGNPHIGYFDATNFFLKYASKASGIWTIENADATGNAAGYLSLALDVQGNPHLSYWDDVNLDLDYASKASGIWTIEIVDAPGDVGAYSSLALDAQNNPRISYIDNVAKDLKYASKSTGGIWTIETVDASTASVGQNSSLALDAQGNPHISYSDITNNDLKYASKANGIWTIEIVDATGIVGRNTSLALDAQGNPSISYYDVTNTNLKYASKADGIWTIETVDADGSVGQYTSLALDAQGNPRISYDDSGNSNLKYASAAIELAEPSPGVTWPVGASRVVTWDGTGRVDLHLSTNGGSSWELLESGLTQGEYRLIVPHTPSKFARFKLERAVPRSVSMTAGLFTIETDISLLSLKAELGQGGMLLSWATSPGPQDLGGYRVEKRLGEADWSSLVAFTRETSVLDPNARPGSQYRLFGINGLGQELLLGETTFGILTPLSVGPLPYRGGGMNITFASDGGSLETEVSLYDLRGRKVRTLARGRYPVGIQGVTWDGVDDTQTMVASGAYFLRLSDGGRTVAMSKIIVAR